MGQLEEDRELLRHFADSSMPQENFNSDYEYQWEYRGANGRYLWAAKALGWDFVRGAHAENPSIRDESGNCTIGDVALMRIPKDRYKQLRDASTSLAREARGDMNEEAMRNEIDQRISRLVGSNVRVAFEFRDTRDLDSRR